METEQLHERLIEARARMAQAASRANRDPDETLLLAVTKTHPLDTIRAACAAGLRHFGENRVEEASRKIAEAGATLPTDVVWHMIGHIQSRKTDNIAGRFAWAHSVDRLKIARRLSDAAGERGKTLEALIEVNLSGEEAKSGFELAGWPDDRGHEQSFLAEVEAMLELPHLRTRGLMTMAPYSDNPEDSRGVFRRTSQLREWLRNVAPQGDWWHLSMGMSGDFEVAIEEGSTIVRLGTALFGSRDYG